MWVFMKSWGALIIAGLALIRPELVALYERIFKKEEIEIHKSGYLEIEYTPLGPVLGIYGQLRCLNRDLFVQNIQLKLERKRDHLTHTFEWLVFRNTKVPIKGEDLGPFEMPFGIMLSTSTPHRFHISFNDTETLDVLRQAAEKLKKIWNEYLFEERKRLGLEGADLSKSHLFEIYKKFKGDRGSKIDSETYAALNQEFYWSPEDYKLEMIVRTWRPILTFREKWEFKLTEQDSQTLRLNTIKMLDDIYGSPSGDNYIYQSVFVKYEKVKSPAG